MGKFNKQDDKLPSKLQHSSDTEVVAKGHKQPWRHRNIYKKTTRTHLPMRAINNLCKYIIKMNQSTKLFKRKNKHVAVESMAATTAAPNTNREQRVDSDLNESNRDGGHYDDAGIIAKNITMSAPIDSPVNIKNSPIATNANQPSAMNDTTTTVEHQCLATVESAAARSIDEGVTRSDANVKKPKPKKRKPKLVSSKLDIAEMQIAAMGAAGGVASLAPISPDYDPPSTSSQNDVCSLTEPTTVPSTKLVEKKASKAIGAPKAATTSPTKRTGKNPDGDEGATTSSRKRSKDTFVTRKQLVSCKRCSLSHTKNCQYYQEPTLSPDVVRATMP